MIHSCLYSYGSDVMYGSMLTHHSTHLRFINFYYLKEAIMATRKFSKSGINDILNSVVTPGMTPQQAEKAKAEEYERLLNEERIAQRKSYGIIEDAAEALSHKETMTLQDSEQVLRWLRFLWSGYVRIRKDNGDYLEPSLVVMNQRKALQLTAVGKLIKQCQASLPLNAEPDNTSDCPF